MYFFLFISIIILSLYLLYPYIIKDKKIEIIKNDKIKYPNSSKSYNFANYYNSFYVKIMIGDPLRASSKLKSSGLYDIEYVHKFIIAKTICLIAAIIIIFPSIFLIDKYNYSSFFLTMLPIIISSFIVYFSPNLYVSNRTIKRRINIKKYWPDALDLMLVCVESGSTIEYSFIKVSKNIKYVCSELSDEIDYTINELSVINDRKEVFHNLSKRTEIDSIETFVQCVIQAERYGTPIGQALRILAQESREQRMQLAERKAAALPPKLTVPMILFFLPVIFAVILTPAIIQISAQGGIMGGN